MINLSSFCLILLSNKKVIKLNLLKFNRFFRAGLGFYERVKEWIKKYKVLGMEI